MKLSEANEPLRIFDEVMQGGLGTGNIGVLMSRHGMGKVGVLTAIAIDHALAGNSVLHVAVGKTVSDIRAYHDAVLDAFVSKIDVDERAGIVTKVERNKQIHAYRDGAFTVKRLEETLDMLAEHADFRPVLLDISGWPDFQTLQREELQELKRVAKEYKAEIWITAHTFRKGHPVNERGVPDYVSRFDDLLSVMIVLQAEDRQVNIRFAKTHDADPPDEIQLEFDPKTQLIKRR